MKEQISCDLVILGGGPAGMTAAVYAAQANLHTVLLDTAVTGGLVNSTHTVKNFPSQKEIHGITLMEKMRDQVDALDVPVEEVCDIEQLDLSGETKIIETDECIYHARSVILGTGRKPAPFYLDEECEEIHYCAVCDGSPYKGKRVLVVGGGNSAFDEGLYLHQLGVSHLTLVEEMDRFFAAPATRDQLCSQENVTAMTSTRVCGLTMEEGRLTGVRLSCEDGEKTIPVDGIFVFMGQIPSNEIFKDQIALDDQGYIPSTPHMETNLPGVFSAGDINAKTFRQITTAMSDGTIAALSAQRYLNPR